MTEDELLHWGRTASKALAVAEVICTCIEQHIDPAEHILRFRELLKELENDNIDD